MSDQIAVENVNSPGQVTRVDAARYAAMKDAMLTGLGGRQITANGMKAATVPNVSQDLFPGGATSGRWEKMHAARP